MQLRGWRSIANLISFKLKLFRLKCHMYSNSTSNMQADPSLRYMTLNKTLFLQKHTRQ